MPEKINFPPRVDIRILERQLRLWEAEKECEMELSSPFFYADLPDPLAFRQKLESVKGTMEDVRVRTRWWIAEAFAIVLSIFMLTFGSTHDGWNNSRPETGSFFCGVGLIVAIVTLVGLISMITWTWTERRR